MPRPRLRLLSWEAAEAAAELVRFELEAAVVAGPGADCFPPVAVEGVEDEAALLLEPGVSSSMGSMLDRRS